jgi:hypothetical protein
VISWDSIEQWQRFLTLPIVAGVLAILRRIHPLRLLQRLLSFGIGVTEREMLLAMIEAEKASGLRWKAQWDICQSDLQAADAQAARLRTRLATLDDSGGGGT